MDFSVCKLGIARTMGHHANRAVFGFRAGLPFFASGGRMKREQEQYYQEPDALRRVLENVLKGRKTMMLLDKIQLCMNGFRTIRYRGNPGPGTF